MSNHRFLLSILITALYLASSKGDTISGMKDVGGDSCLGNRLKANELKYLLSKSVAGMTAKIILSAGIRETTYIYIGLFFTQMIYSYVGKSFNAQDST